MPLIQGVDEVGRVHSVRVTNEGILMVDSGVHGITVQDDSLTPSYDNVTVLQFDSDTGLYVSSPNNGIALVRSFPVSRYLDCITVYTTVMNTTQETEILRGTVPGGWLTGEGIVSYNVNVYLVQNTGATRTFTIKMYYRTNYVTMNISVSTSATPKHLNIRSWFIYRGSSQNYSGFITANLQGTEQTIVRSDLSTTLHQDADTYMTLQMDVASSSYNFGVMYGCLRLEKEDYVS